VAGFFFVLVISATAVLAIRYRRRKAGEKTSDVSHSTALEITWTTIPLIILMVLFGMGLKGYVNAAVAPAEAMEIKVTAEKWLWTFTYPNGTTTVNELGVPKDRPVRLLMSSKDIVHSFFVPEFRIKQDVVPGAYTTTWFQATEAKEVAVLCAEYCGTGHSDMMAKVIVMEDAQFKDWLDKGGGGSDLPPAELGKKLFTARNCATCHSLDGTRITGPSLKDLFGRNEEMSDGKQVLVDENYFRESVLDPMAKVVHGYPPVMPVYKGLLKDTEIDALIAYLKTVK
jgi:cytochrome c oxidase subunit 2